MVVEACPGPQCPGQLQGGFVFERTPFREEDEGDGESEGDTETFRVKMKPVAQKGRSREGQDWPSGLETENRGDRGDSWGTPGLEGSLRKVARDSPIICKQRSRKASGPELVGQEPPGDSLGGSKGGPRGCPPPQGSYSRKNALCSCSPGGKEPGNKKWPKEAARLKRREHRHRGGEDQRAGGRAAEGRMEMAGGSRKGLLRGFAGRERCREGLSLLAEVPGALGPLSVGRAAWLQGRPWPAAHRSCSRSWVSFSRAFRCRMHTSFCCRGVRYCSGVGGLTPWLSLQSVYFMERLQGDTCQRGVGRHASLSWSHRHQMAPG